MNDDKANRRARKLPVVANEVAGFVANEVSAFPYRRPPRRAAVPLTPAASDPLRVSRNWPLAS